MSALSRRVVTALLLLICTAAPLAAQTAVVTRNVNLRTGPFSSAQAIIRPLSPPDELIILSPDKTNG